MNLRYKKIKPLKESIFSLTKDNAGTLLNEIATYADQLAEDARELTYSLDNGELNSIPKRSHLELNYIEIKNRMEKILNSNIVEGLNEALYGKKEIDEFITLCDKLGLKTFGDLKDFADNNKNRILVNDLLKDFDSSMSTDAFFETLRDRVKELPEDDEFEYDDPLNVIKNKDKKNESLGSDGAKNSIEVEVKSGIGGDGFKVIVKDTDGNIIEQEDFSYGYNASYSRSWADKDKPFVADIINNYLTKYNLNKDDLILIKGKNVFTGGPVRDEVVTRFRGYLNESLDFSKKTKQGFEVVEMYRDGGRLHAIIKRNSDYVVALGYNTSDGTWAQGRYVNTYENAIKTLKEEKPFAKKIQDTDTVKDPKVRWTFIKSKEVEDSDGFLTDYTWYEGSDGTQVMVFGDNDIYKPEDGYFDVTFTDRKQAEDWFNSY